MKKGVGGHSRTLLAVTVLVAAAAAATASTGGNDFYRVTIENTPGGVGIGVYTVTTGSAHPVTGALGPQNVLFGGGIPGTSYTTIRSFTSGTDYTQRTGLALLPGAPPTLLLEAFVAPGEEAVPIGDPNSPSGFITTYRLAPGSPAADALTVVQSCSAVGGTFNTSAVKIETAITNEGGAPVSIGLRYLWDFQIGPGDDGPVFREIGPDGAFRVLEWDVAAPLFDSYEIQDNNDAGVCFAGGNSPFPFFDVRGSVLGPAALAPTPPTRLTYLAWPSASGLAGRFGGVIPAASAFDYVPTGVDAASCDISVDDSGVAYWWGDQASNALTIAPGATVSVAAYIYAHLVGAPPDFQPPATEGPPCTATCTDGIDNDGDGLIDLEDPDCVGVEGPYGDPSCEDAVDNDCDGAVDGDDPDCQPPPNQPPDCTTAASDPDLLWPPNHKFRPVSILGVTDPDGDPVTLAVTSIMQDEPLNGLGDGNTCSDGAGVGEVVARVRAERSGQGDGRVYHISFTADDGNGGVCAGEVSVCVPHDRSARRRVCGDQGPLYDSTTPCVGRGKDRRK